MTTEELAVSFHAPARSQPVELEGFYVVGPRDRVVAGPWKTARAAAEAMTALFRARAARRT